MNLNIRKASIDDAEKIAYVRSASWRAAYAGIVPDEYLKNISLDTRADKFRADIAGNPDMNFFVAELDRNVIGILILSKCRDKDVSNAGEIDGIYLLPEYIGKGYGTDMIRFSVSFLANAGFDSIYLWVLEENNQARKFYQKCGFSADGSKKKMNIGKHLNVIRMRTKIKL